MKIHNVNGHLKFGTNVTFDICEVHICIKRIQTYYKKNMLIFVIFLMELFTQLVMKYEETGSIEYQKKSGGPKGGRFTETCFTQ